LLVRSIPSSSSSTNQHTILFSLGRITSTVETTAIRARSMMNEDEREREERTNERTNQLLYAREKEVFSFLFFFFSSLSLGFEL